MAAADIAAALLVVTAPSEGADLAVGSAYLLRGFLFRLAEPGWKVDSFLDNLLGHVIEHSTTSHQRSFKASRKHAV